MLAMTDSFAIFCRNFSRDSTGEQPGWSWKKMIWEQKDNNNGPNDYSADNNYSADNDSTGEQPG